MVNRLGAIVRGAWRKLLSPGLEPFRHPMHDHVPSHQPIEQIHAIHAAYVESTGLEVNPMVHHWTYSNLLFHGYTPEDVKTVVRRVQELNRRQEFKRSLGVTKLLGDVERFDETLAEAKAIERNKVQRSAKDRVVAQWQRLPAPEEAAIPRCVSLKEALLSAIENETQRPPAALGS